MSLYSPHSHADLLTFPVFLRVLEYYSGVLILTTNRVGQFNKAIKSRINLSLYYPPLNEDQSLKIWGINLKRPKRVYGAETVVEDSKNRRKPALPVIKFNSKQIMDFAKGH